MLLKVLKFTSYGFIALVLAMSVYFYTQIYDYSKYELKVDSAKFSGVNGQAEIDILAKNLIAKMTLAEKIQQLYGEDTHDILKLVGNVLLLDRFPHFYVGRNERLGIPPFVLSDGPRGARLADSYGGATTFPVAMSRGASWDVDLESRINDVIAKEIRASGANMAATPCINLLRHPGWGRAQETYGEDPWLLGQFGVAATHAIQYHNVMASPKHYAINSIENSRFVVNVELDERTLREVYLPHFKKVVQEGETASLMTAYNKVRGEYASNNHYLLTEILREEWGFAGFLHSDWFFAVYDAVESIKAGLNIEMPVQYIFSDEAIEAGLENNQISEADIDTLIYQSLRVRLKYALAEDPMVYDRSLLADSKHTQLALEAAEQGMVLLKNEQVLPFGKTSGKTIAVIGAIADLENTGDMGSSNSKSPYIITPYAGLKAYHAKLGNTVVLDDGSDVARARALAEASDEVVLVVGYTHENEGEYLIASDAMAESAKAGKLVGKKGIGGDRDVLSLLPNDERMIDALADSNEKLVVVYVGGSAIDMAAWDSKVPAILFAWYAGMEGGNALANILYGDANPGGKLPFAMPKDAANYPYFTPYTDNITYGYYHGYTLFDKNNIEVAYPFGFGLSYSSFAYSNLTMLTPELPKTGTVQVSVELTNTSDVAGNEAVQLYVGFANSSVDRPVKILRDFKKVPLLGGETKTVTLAVDIDDLAWYNPATPSWEVETMEYEVYVGSSAAPQDLLSAEFQVH
ncbi:MAG TPA: glycosyl hydrolase [Porticoccus sp.]|nr:glycosyl hydrolase [Porticoccus sp.]